MRKIALAALLALLASGPLQALAQTPAGTISGCEFSRCSAGTAECCRQAREQSRECRASLEADRDNYANFGKEGAEAKEAVEQCVRCSEVYISNFCGRTGGLSKGDSKTAKFC